MAMVEAETSDGEPCIGFAANREPQEGTQAYITVANGWLKLTLPAVSGQHFDIDQDTAHQMIGVLQHYLHYQRLGTGVDAFRVEDLVIGTSEDNKGTIGRVTGLSDACVAIQPINPGGELETWMLPVGKCWALYSRPPEEEPPTAWDLIRKDD